MSERNIINYYETLEKLLQDTKTITGFLYFIFDFLAKRTDLYYVRKDPNERKGFPPGGAEELVLEALRNSDPNYWNKGKMEQSNFEIDDNATNLLVGQEVEVIEEEQPDNPEPENSEIVDKKKELFPEDYEAPVIPVQKNSDTYNGAERDSYSWSQTIMELDVIVKLPPDVKSAKDLKVNINSGDMSVHKRNGDVIIKDTFPYKIKTLESFWTVTDGKLLIHLEKLQERWWNKLLSEEQEIDLSKIDCSRPLNELPEDHIAKVRELQWNQEQKRKGLPTSDEIRNIEILRKAWNADGSPFKGKEFDPSVLSNVHIQN